MSSSANNLLITFVSLSSAMNILEVEIGIIKEEGESGGYKRGSPIVNGVFSLTNMFKRSSSFSRRS